MSKVPDSHLFLDFDVGKERSLEIHLESEYAVLVRASKRCTIYSTVRRNRDGPKIQSMERRQHRELELNFVAFGQYRRRVVCRLVF